MDRQILGAVLDSMVEYYKGDAKRIQHFIKVHAFAKEIGLRTGLSDNEQLVLEVAAYVHDIGIKKAEELYNSSSGELQEKLGVGIANEMLLGIGLQQQIVERVCYLVGHHHTYSSIEGLDYRILVEADFLVNLQEEQTPKSGIISAYNKLFVTEYGKQLCRQIFDI